MVLLCTVMKDSLWVVYLVEGRAAEKFGIIPSYAHHFEPAARNLQHPSWPQKYTKLCETLKEYRPDICEQYVDIWSIYET